MTQRLRAQGEADAVSEVTVKLEGLERELTLESETIQHAYEVEALQLQHISRSMYSKLMAQANNQNLKNQRRVA